MRKSSNYVVILAYAGIQLLSRHPRERGDPAFGFESQRFKPPNENTLLWIPACAGMTEKRRIMERSQAHSPSGRSPSCNLQR